MKEYIILFNSLSNNGNGAKVLNSVRNMLGKNKSEYIDVSKVTGYKEILSEINNDVKILLIGGDGTLNRFVNIVADMKLPNEIYYYPAGTGNDFWNDVMGKAEKNIIQINKYIEHLPVITVKGERYYFINGIGYGIDGYCCEEADKIRECKPNKRINYTNIALKGLLYDYKTCHARVTVDGVTNEFDNVWLAPTMKGRFFGGGMMPTPNQNRLDDEHRVSVLIFANKNKLGTLLRFPKVFTGKHVSDTRHAFVYTGKSVKIEFDKPTALQVDGETLL